MTYEMIEDCFHPIAGALFPASDGKTLGMESREVGDGEPDGGLL